MRTYRGRPIKDIKPFGHGSNSYYVIYADTGGVGIAHQNELMDGIRSDEPISIGNIKGSIDATMDGRQSLEQPSMDAEAASEQELEDIENSLRQFKENRLNKIEPFSDQSLPEKGE